MTNPLASFLYARGLVAEDMPQDQILERSRQVAECLTKLVKDLQELNADNTEE